jgi:Domain of unknown function (DUF3854)
MSSFNTDKVAKTQISFTTGVAAAACKSDVSWSEGLAVATHYDLVPEYEARHGFPIENLQKLDTGFWVWAQHHAIDAADCQRIWNNAPTLEWDDFVAECVNGSDIRQSMFDLNTQRIFNSGYGRYEVLETLNMYTARFVESRDGVNWNRISGEEKFAKFGGELYAFASGRNGFFNGKPRIAFWDGEKGKYRKYESRRKSKYKQEEGNQVFFPDVDTIACEKLVANLGLSDDFAFASNWITPQNYWEVVFAFPKLIRVGVAEGAKKAISLTAEGFPCVAILGVTNWSVSGSEPRELLPELARLADGGRSVDIWYDMDDPSEKIKAFLNGKVQGHKLLQALYGAGANIKSRMMFWDLKLGKGIDDAKSSLRHEAIELLGLNLKLTASCKLKSEVILFDRLLAFWVAAANIPLQLRDLQVRSWIKGTIEFSRPRELYAQTRKMYDLDPKRSIVRDTVGDYMPGDIKIAPNHITALIADTGSGKTHQIRELIRYCRSLGIVVVVFTPTNKLGEQAAHNFDIPHRNTVGENGFLLDRSGVLAEARERGGLVVCPDSMEWAESLVKTASNYIVVCDEAAKVLEHLSGGATIKERYSEINEGFAALLVNAQSLILAEAKISEKDLLTYEAISGKKSLIYRHQKETAKRQVQFYTGAVDAIFATLMAEIDDRLERGEKVLIPADSQRMCEKVERYLQARHPDKLGIRNDAHTSYLSEVKTLTKTPNEFLAHHRISYLIFSPVCKAGWDLKGFYVDLNEIRHNYKFDAVCAFFIVLPTSDLVQMVGRYRPNAPLSIACPEVIQQVGDETAYSQKILRRLRGEELTHNLHFCKLNGAARVQFPIQKLLDDIYTHNTIRNGSEKSIARFALQQRLIDDGHDVSIRAVSLAQLKDTDLALYDRLTIISRSLKDIGETIDRDWANAIATTALRLEDGPIEAARIERMESPTPIERAKAAKIRLIHRFPGVNFDNATTVYHTTRKHGKLGSGADLHAKLNFLDLIKFQQRERNTAILNENIIAVQHLSREAQRTALMLDVGILSFLQGEYSKESAEMIALKQRCLDRAKEFKWFFGLDFSGGQEVMTFYGRLMSKLSIPHASYRPGGSGTRVYYVETVSSILEQIDSLDCKKERLEERIYNMEVKQGCLNDRRDAQASRYQRAKSKHEGEYSSVWHENVLAKSGARLERSDTRLERARKRLADCGARIDKFTRLLESTEVRALLFGAATARLSLASTTLINNGDIGLVDASLSIEREGIQNLEKPLDFDERERKSA